MARRAKSVASRGSINNIILDSLASGQKYGYEIIKEVEEKTNGKIKLKQPSLYSSLKRFETKGIITSYWGDSDIGGRRHYYSLTKHGQEYYNKLKSKGEDIDEDNDIDEDILPTEENSIEENQVDESEYIIDDSQNDNMDLEKRYSNFSVEEKMKQLLSPDNDEESALSEEQNSFESHENETISQNNDEDDKEELLNQLYTEIEEEPEEYIKDEKEEIIPDHNFYKQVPLSEYKNEKYEESYIKLYGKEAEERPEQNTTEEKEAKVVEDTPPTHQNKKPRIITDELGITKLVYDDEDTKRRQNTVIDNVVIRTNPTNLNNDLAKVHNKQNIKTHNILDHLSDEEREERNQKFVKKFNDITSERMTAPSPQESSEYKERLNRLVEENEIEENLYEKDYSEAVYLKEEQKEEIDKKIITKKFNEIIDDESINVKVYSQSSKTTNDNKYLLVNKAKFAFGLTMLILMLLELTVAMIILKNNGTLYKDKMWAFEIGYAIIALVCLYYCIPVFISPNKQATSPFKLNYSIMFGLLAFFVSLILVYTINTFMGLDFENIKYFTPTLVAPVVLASNFILGPLLYKVITLNKKFY